MRIGNFSLAIRDSNGRIHEGDENGYVVLRHGEQYTLLLGNFSGGKAVIYAKLDERAISDDTVGLIQILQGIVPLERIPGGAALSPL